MFDFGFSELMVIGAVALVVLGPERLPTVARTAGEWLGKAQRLVQQVKSDIEREAELSELKKFSRKPRASPTISTRPSKDRSIRSIPKSRIWKVRSITLATSSRQVLTRLPKRASAKSLRLTPPTAQAIS